MNGLSFFTRTSMRGCWDVVSYHPPRSLTWLWSVSFKAFRGDEARVWPIAGASRNHEGLLCGFVRIPMIGVLQLFRQRGMPMTVPETPVPVGACRDKRGRWVVIDRTDGLPPYPLIGRVSIDGGWEHQCWTRDGRAYMSRESLDDLLLEARHD